MSRAKLNIGDDLHIQGFILNKLYGGRYFWRPGRRRQFLRSIRVEDIRKGYRPQYRGRFARNIQELRRKGLIVVFPLHGAKRACATNDPNTIQQGLNMCNAFLNAQGVPLLGKDFREILC